MTLDQLIFVGLRGYVVALDRDTGEVVWSNDKLNSGYTTLLLDGDRLIASTNGYMYCLDPLTGGVMWQNPLRGYGTGVTDLASVRGRGPRATLPNAAAADAAQSAAAASSAHGS
jgi:outer membrane protein assembly factor BamB